MLHKGGHTSRSFSVHTQNWVQIVRARVCSTRLISPPSYYFLPQLALTSFNHTHTHIYIYTYIYTHTHNPIRATLNHNTQVDKMTFFITNTKSTCQFPEKTQHQIRFLMLPKSLTFLSRSHVSQCTICASNGKADPLTNTQVTEIWESLVFTYTSCWLKLGRWCRYTKSQHVVAQQKQKQTISFFHWQMISNTNNSQNSFFIITANQSEIIIITKAILCTDTALLDTMKGI